MKICVRSDLHTGGDFDGTGLITALLDAGADVHLAAGPIAPPLARVVANLLTKTPPRHYDLLLHLGDPANLGLVGRVADIQVAWTNWDHPSLDDSIAAAGLADRLRDYDLVLANHAVTAAALAPYTDTIATLHTGFWPQVWPRLDRDWFERDFDFGVIDSGTGAEPATVAQALAELRTEHPKEFSHVFDTVLGPTDGLRDPAKRRSWYADVHVLITSGQGITANTAAMEFMSTGGPVIAPTRGAAQQWLSSSYALPVSPGPGGFDLASLKDQMVRVRRDRDTTARLGTSAARAIADIAAWPAVIRRLYDKIGELPRSGAVVHHAHHAQALKNERSDGR